MSNLSTRPLLSLVALLLLGALELPSAHSGAPGSYREAERPPGRTGPQEGPPTCYVCTLARHHDLQMTPLALVPRTRCGPKPDAPVAAIRPRGLVAPADLAEVRVDLGEAFDDAITRERDGVPRLRIEIRAGTRSLGHLEVPVDAYRNRVLIPPTLRARLAAVDEPLRWGRFDLNDPRATAPLRILRPAGVAGRRLERIDHALAKEPLWVRHVVRGQAWLEAGYVERALDEARAALTLRPAEPHAAALLALAFRLQGMEGLEETAATERAVWKHLTPHAVAGRPLACELDKPLPHAVATRLRRLQVERAERAARARSRASGSRR